MKTITIEHRQTVKDVAIQHCGHIDGSLQICLLNNIAKTDDLKPGQTLIVPEPIKADVVAYFQQRSTAGRLKHIPATAEVAPHPEGDNPEGIGYWEIELDFIVQ